MFISVSQMSSIHTEYSIHEKDDTTSGINANLLEGTLSASHSAPITPVMDAMDSAVSSMLVIRGCILRLIHTVCTFSRFIEFGGDDERTQIFTEL